MRAWMEMEKSSIFTSEFVCKKLRVQRKRKLRMGGNPITFSSISFIRIHSTELPLTYISRWLNVSTGATQATALSGIMRKTINKRWWIHIIRLKVLVSGRLIDEWRSRGDSMQISLNFNQNTSPPTLQIECFEIKLDSSASLSFHSSRFDLLRHQTSIRKKCFRRRFSSLSSFKLIGVDCEKTFS